MYRRYAGLYFSLGVDVSDNELAALEAVHLFVEILDHYFSNVCELDLVFNFHKVRGGEQQQQQQRWQGGGGGGDWRGERGGGGEGCSSTRRSRSWARLMQKRNSCRSRSSCAACSGQVGSGSSRLLGCSECSGRQQQEQVELGTLHTAAGGSEQVSSSAMGSGHA